jgi:integrase
MVLLAVGEGWLSRNPFAVTRGSAPVINTRQEHARERTCSAAEEAAVLSFCIGERAHLRIKVIAAVETGMREGELNQLVRRDVDFIRQRITVTRSKTGAGRTVPMTDRLREELDDAGVRFLASDARVFVAGTSKSFRKACELAKVSGLQFRDLRMTAGMRMLRGGLSLAEVGKILGHSDPRTTYRWYVAATEATMEQAIDIARAAAGAGSSSAPAKHRNPRHLRPDRST